jgi:hypothetical protein
MRKSWNVHLKGYLAPNGTVAAFPPQILRLAKYWTEIVAQASNYDAPTTLKCRRWYRRRRCGGSLTIFFDADNHDVLWFCPICDDQGRISGWGGTFWDNSELAEQNS